VTPADWNAKLLSDPGATLALRRRERSLSRRSGLVYLDGRVVRVIDLQLRPRVILRRQLAHLARLAGAIAAVQRRVAAGWAGSTDLQRVLPLGGRERELFLATATPAALRAPVVSRLDASMALGRSTWKDDLRLFEVNSVGVGGMHLVPTAEEVVGRIHRQGGEGLQPCPDLRIALMRLLEWQARRLGAKSPVLGIVEDRSEPGGTAEYDWIARRLRAHGARVVVADVRRLALDRGRLVLAGTRVDVVYRDVEVKDLFALREADGARAAFREAMAAGRLVSGIAGDFDHKSLWEVITDRRLAGRWLTAAERRLLAPHVLWTRLVQRRRTRH